MDFPKQDRDIARRVVEQAMEALIREDFEGFHSLLSPDWQHMDDLESKVPETVRWEGLKRRWSVQPLVSFEVFGVGTPMPSFEAGGWHVSVGVAERRRYATGEREVRCLYYVLRDRIVRLQLHELPGFPKAGDDDFSDVV